MTKKFIVSEQEIKQIKNLYINKNLLTEVETNTVSGVDSPLARKNKLSSVGLFQQALSDLGYDVGIVDNKFGTKTKNAIISFQKDESLKSQNGEMNEETAKMLSKRLADNFTDNSKKELQDLLQNYKITQTPKYEADTSNKYIDSLATSLNLQGKTQQEKLNQIMGELNKITPKKA